MNVPSNRVGNASVFYSFLNILLEWIFEGTSKKIYNKKENLVDVREVNSSKKYDTYVTIPMRVMRTQNQ